MQEYPSARLDLTKLSLGGWGRSAVSAADVLGASDLRGERRRAHRRCDRDVSRVARRTRAQPHHPLRLEPL